MPKVKTHQGTAKRFKITGSGKFMHDKARKNHLMSNKKRADKPFGYGKEISDAEFANVKSLLPYGK
ncbi:MAG: 50S ribosomal protein L35 [Candidatus Absconditabacterales bacterium]